MTEVLHNVVADLFGDDAPAVTPVLDRTLGVLAGRGHGIRARIQAQRARRELTEYVEASIAVRRTIDGPGADLLSRLAIERADAGERAIAVLVAAHRDQTHDNLHKHPPTLHPVIMESFRSSECASRTRSE